MDITFEKCDLSFAIQARKIMLYEKWKNNERLDKFVWRPTQEFLENMAKSVPKQIICFFGKEYNFPNQSGCKCSNIFIVNELKKVAYLGTVFNKTAIAIDSAQLMSLDPNLAKKYHCKVSRTPTHYVIPSSKEHIDEKVIIKSIKKLLRSYKGEQIPLLARATVALLSRDKGAELEKQIIAKAKQLANPDL